MSKYLQCPQCDSFACDPIEEGDQCWCGEAEYKITSNPPFEGFEMGCTRCAYEWSSIKAGECTRGKAMNYTSCGATG